MKVALMCDAKADYARTSSYRADQVLQKTDVLAFSEGLVNFNGCEFHGEVFAEDGVLHLLFDCKARAYKIQGRTPKKFTCSDRVGKFCYVDEKNEAWNAHIEITDGLDEVLAAIDASMERNTALP